MLTGEEVTDCLIDLVDIDDFDSTPTGEWCVHTTVDDISDGVPELLPDDPATADTAPHRKRI